MNKQLTTLALCAALTSMLAACGGGGDSADQPDATNLPSSLTITSATVAANNGVYGATQTGVSDVTKVQDIGGDKCDFSFNNVVMVGNTAMVIRGNVQYNENAPTLASSTNFFVGGEGYIFSPANGDGTTVDRAANRVTFTNKRFGVQTNTNTFVVNGYLPMKPNRPNGC